MLSQKMLFESGNEVAALAIKQINYHVMGYYPITPSTQIAEELDLMISQGDASTVMVAAEGEHSAAGICYGASVGGGRVVNATSANGLLYSLEQLPVQSGTRFPMLLNVACRTVSGPLSIKGDHSDIMYALNSGWIILFAKDNQEVYDFNIIGLKLAEAVKLPVIVAYDGFFTSHQKKKLNVFEKDEDVQGFVGKYKAEYTALDVNKPVTIGSYMNEPDLMNNKYQLHLAMEEAKEKLLEIFEQYRDIAGRGYRINNGYMTEDADIVLFVLGSAFDTAKEAVERIREKGHKVGVFTMQAIRPWFRDKVYEMCKNAKMVIVADRQDSYGAGGGNMSIEIKATLKDCGSNAKVITRIFGLGGRDFYVHEAEKMFEEALKGGAKEFDYIGCYEGNLEQRDSKFFEPVNNKNADISFINVEKTEDGRLIAKGGAIKDTTKMPKRMIAGHGACPGCGIPVNINLLLSAISGNVVLLFHTGCAMVVSTAYPKTSFKVNYVHNLFQNGAATLSGLVEMFKERQRRGEMSKEDITFVMVSGDGGLDIGLGSALASAIRNHNMIIFEYDNGGYMNTGYQLSYSTPKGAKSSTCHLGEFENGKKYFHKDNPQIFAATNIPYVATVAESNITDFIKKAKKAQVYAKDYGLSYIKALSACPLNWNDEPRYERSVIDMAVKCCYHPLYEIENGITTINYNPEAKGDKVDIINWFKMMGRTKHLQEAMYGELVADIQKEVDRRWECLKARADSPYL